MVMVIAAWLWTATAFAADLEVQGHIFYEPLDSARPSFSFRSVTTELPGGGQRVVSSYRDTAGKDLVTEEAEIVNDRLTRYVYKQNQVSEHGEAVVAGGKVKMSFFEDGQTARDEEKDDPNLIVAPMIGPLLRRKWDDLMKGDSIKVRYLAIERLETIGFKFYKDGERTLRGKAVVDILMKPSSFFISAMVSPIRLAVLKEAPHWIVESDGRTPIRVTRKPPPHVRRDWKAIDARVEYEVPASAPAPAPAPPAVPVKPKPKDARQLPTLR